MFIFKLLTIIGSIACLFSVFADGMTVYNKQDHNFADFWYQSQAISHIINNIMVYTIYIHRLHLSFNETMFKISNTMFKILTFFVYCDILDFIIECICYAILTKHE